MSAKKCEGGESKVYILDTSALIHDPRLILRLGDNIIVIPICVLSELDKLKTKIGNLGFNAREAISLIEELTSGGLGPAEMATGVRTSSGGKLFFDMKDSDWSKIPDGLDRQNDTRVLVAAKNAHEKHRGKKVIVLSQDVNLRVIARSCGIVADDVHSSRAVENLNDLYTGRWKIKLPEDQAGYFQTLYHEKRLPLSLLRSHLPECRDLYPNECVEISAGDKFAAGIVEKDALCVVPINGESRGHFPVPMRNHEQCLGFSLLKRVQVDLTTLVGQTGSGKTFLALLAAHFLTNNDDSKRIMVFRPHVELGPEFGILPGTVEEKFSPWTRPVREIFRKIFCANGMNSDQAKKHLEEMLRFEFIEIKPITHIRGCTFDNVTIVIDEGQNLTPHEIRSVITRAGEGSRIIITGDPTQIDNRFLDSRNNGLVYVTEHFKDDIGFAHLTFEKSVRSSLAERAARRLPA